jgi:hypothetical protein
MFAESARAIRRVASIHRILALLAAALAMQGFAQAQGAGSSSGSLYGKHGVTPDGVRQGILGSCYFHSSIAALAKAAPDTLRNAISRNPMGGYLVHFSTGPDEAVFPEDIEYGRAHNFDRSDGDWVLVLMRGYAQRAVRKGLADAIQRSDAMPAYAKPVALEWLDHSGLLLVAYDRAIRSVVGQDGSMDEAAFKRALTSQLSARGIPDAESTMLIGFLDNERFFDRLAYFVQRDGEVFGAYKALGQGGIPVRVIEAFMGSAHALMVADHQMTMDCLHRLHRDNTAMVAGSWSRAPADLADANWWVSAHAYTVLDYDEDSQTVVMRNPWGTHPDPNGLFTLPLATFLEGFESASFSDAPY